VRKASALLKTWSFASGGLHIALSQHQLSLLFLFNVFNRFLPHPGRVPNLQSVVMSMSMSACASVCLSARMTQTLRVRPSPKFCASCLWPWLGLRHCDTLCTSGFTGDVMFSCRGTNGRPDLDKIRLQGRLTSSTLPEPPMPSVMSDN